MSKKEKVRKRVNSNCRPKSSDRKKKQRKHLSRRKKTQNNLNATKKVSSNSGIVNVNYLKSLNMKYWRRQDHYHVLGLQNLRYYATPADIRKAFRKVMLEHHPAKRRRRGEIIDTNHHYFDCIVKAYEVLSQPLMKRSYDSVDPTFDNSLPTKKQIDKDFYATFQKYFHLNSRWSEYADVPSFGDKSSSRNEVRKFYRFWYNFKSWREFSYLDIQYNDQIWRYDPEIRRRIDRANRINRYKRKKEEKERIRKLVDLAYENDERIKQIRHEERQKCLGAKKKKMAMTQVLKPKINTQLKIKQQHTVPKRSNKTPPTIEQHNAALQQHERILKDKIEEHNYFQNTTTGKSLLQIKKGVERICHNFNLEALRKLNRSLAGENAATAFYETLTAMEEEQAAQRKHKEKTTSAFGKTKTSNMMDIWNPKTIDLLDKAVILYPANISQRCRFIAYFINRNADSDRKVTPADVVYKLKVSMSPTRFTKIAKQLPHRTKTKTKSLERIDALLRRMTISKKH